MRTTLVFLLLLSLLLLSLLLLTSACSGGEIASDVDGGVAPSDGALGPDSGPNSASKPFADLTLQTVESGTVFDGFMWDGEHPLVLTEQSRQDNCVVFSLEANFCDPACSGGAVCTPGNRCVARPAPMGLGTINVTGTTPELAVSPSTSQHYQGGEMVSLDNGVPVTVSGEGDNGIAAFELNASGIARLTLPTANLVATETQDMVVLWHTVDSPVGTEIVLHFDSDHHGLPAYLECVSDDDGELIIPAALLDSLIAVGETGIGTYIENAYLLRRNRSVLEREDANLMLTVLSLLPVSVETVRAQ